MTKVLEKKRKTEIDELVFMTASHLAKLVRKRKVSSEEVVEAHLSHITRSNPDLNAVVTVDGEQAMQKAREADKALSHEEIWGPLHGVPVTVKDNFQTAGMRTTFGSSNTTGYYPSQDATVVERLRAAGAIIIGKTNVSVLPFDWQCSNPIFGRSNNPWDLERTPGGSSGGGAAAVAAGLSPLDIGSGGSGSIRVPAHFCGLYGFKPTQNRISGYGHAQLPGLSQGIHNTIGFGPLARSVDDLRLALTLIAGPDGRQWEVPPVTLADIAGTEQSADTPLNQRRFVFTDDLGGPPISAATREAMDMLAKDLERAGCRVEFHRPQGFDFEGMVETWGEIAGAEIGSNMPRARRFAYRLGAARLYYGGGAWTHGFWRGLNLSLSGYFEALNRRDTYITCLEVFLKDWDAWLAPVASVPAFPHLPHGRSIDVDGKNISYSMAAGAYASLFNLTGNPVAVLPLTSQVKMMSDQRLPIGVQLIGCRWHDMELLNLAEQLTEVTGGFVRPTGY
jgi:amidase